MAFIDDDCEKPPSNPSGPPHHVFMSPSIVTNDEDRSIFKEERESSIEKVQIMGRLSRADNMLSTFQPSGKSLFSQILKFILLINVISDAESPQGSAR